MTTLLHYDLTTDPFPLQASPGADAEVHAQEGRPDTAFRAQQEPDADAGQGDRPDAVQSPATILAISNLLTATLKVTATNLTPSSPVTLQGLSVTLPVGPNASDLTPDATSVQPLAPNGWTPKPPKPGAGTVEYVFQPQEGQGSVGKQGLDFIFNNIEINRQTGTVPIVVKEGSAGSPQFTLYVTKYPNGWGQVSFWVEPAFVQPGGTTTLGWSGPAEATYSIEYYDWLARQAVTVPAQSDPPFSNNGQFPSQGQTLLLLETSTFTLDVALSVEGQQYHGQFQKSVTVEAYQMVTSLTASADGFGVSENVTLNWATQQADSCTLELYGASGTISVGASGSCVVTSADAATLTLTAPDETQLGQLTLPSPTPTTAVFILTATGQLGTEKQVVRVRLLRAQVVAFFRHGFSRTAHDELLDWQVAHAINVTINGVSVGPSGANIVIDPDDQLTLQCDGFGGPVTARA